MSFSQTNSTIIWTREYLTNCGEIPCLTCKCNCCQYWNFLFPNFGCQFCKCYGDKKTCFVLLAWSLACHTVAAFSFLSLYLQKKERKETFLPLPNLHFNDPHCINRVEKKQQKKNNSPGKLIKKSYHPLNSERSAWSWLNLHISSGTDPSDFITLESCSW